MDKRKEEIIEIAIRRFSHYGFAKTTMNEVADDLKITKANLYYYYPDKTALIKDVICSISNALICEVEKIVESYNGDVIESLIALIRYRAAHMRKHYMLYINENLDWIRDGSFAEFIEKIDSRDLDVLKSLLSKAVTNGELKLNDVEESTLIVRNIIKGLALNYTVGDIICGIPNIENIDKIVDSQIKAVKLIFEERIVTNK